MFAGDRPWWNFTYDGDAYGIGEISNKVLFYLGDTFWISPLPSGKVWLLSYALIALAAVLLACFVGLRGRGKHAD